MADDRLNEEVAFHLEQQARKLEARGLSPEEARRRARLRFGGVESTKDSARDEQRGAWLRDLGRDMKYGIRALRRTPGFALLAVLTLGLGIGASTALFSVVEGVLLRDLPYPDPDRLVYVMPINVDSPGAEPRRGGRMAEPNVIDLRQRTRGFEAMAVMSQAGATAVVINGEALLARWTVVSTEFFDVIRVAPAAGRRFVGDELVEGGTPAVLVSAALRARVFGAELPPDASVRLGQTSFAIVGEMPPGFDFPTGTEIWSAREYQPPATPTTSRTGHNHQAIARLADGVSLDTVQADLSAAARQMKTEFGDATWMVDAAAVPILDETVAGIRPALQLLFGAAVVLFVIACTNVTNLLLARDAARSPEVALQLAIGAGRWRIVRQRLAETFVLCLCGAVVGVAVAAFAVRTLLALDPGGVPRLETVAVNLQVVSFALVAALGATMAIGLVASLRNAGADIRVVLADASRSSTGGRSRERAREALVVTQVALTLVLLVGTALLTRSFTQLLAVDPGYRTDGAMLVDVVMPFPADADAETRQWQVQQQFMARLEAQPGVSAVGLISGPPTGGGRYPNGRYFEMTTVDEIRDVSDVAAMGAAAEARMGFAEFRVAGGDYFDAMGIPLLAGRTFEPGDQPDAPHVAVVSQSMADQRWPGRDPIGRFIQFGNMDGDLRGFRVVGVVGDVREITPEAQPGPTFYVDYRQRPRQASRFTMVVSGGGSAVAGAAQGILRQIDPSLPVTTHSVEEAFDVALRGRRFNLMLITAFSIVALGLAVLGTYGLISYLVTQRTREIGIRLALGAAPAAVVALIAGKGARLAVLGIVVGLGAAWLLTGLVGGLLYGTSPTDPGAFISVVALTAAAVILASLLPAWRAARISAAETLK